MGMRPSHFPAAVSFPACLRGRMRADGPGTALGGRWPAFAASAASRHVRSPAPLVGPLKRRTGASAVPVASVRLPPRPGFPLPPASRPLSDRDRIRVSGGRRPPERHRQRDAAGPAGAATGGKKEGPVRRFPGGPVLPARHAAPIASGDAAAGCQAASPTSPAAARSPSGSVR